MTRRRRKAVYSSKSMSSSGIGDMVAEDFKLYTLETNERITTYALKELAEMILAKADEFIPEGETSKLRQSGKIGDVKIIRDKMSITISYGDEEVDYAFFVHENMPSSAPAKEYTRQGTGSHYLSRAADYVLTPNNIKESFRRAFRLLAIK